MSATPIIGATAEFETPQTFAGMGNHSSDRYRASVVAAGGALLWLPSEDREDLRESLLSRVDGLLLTGGKDVPASAYGEDELPFNGTMHARRYNSDFGYLRLALERGIPILAICLGFQELNVALGGTLWQDLPTQRPDVPPVHDRMIFPLSHHHPVTLAPDSRLAAAVQQTEYIVNSAHHQAVRDLAPTLRAVGWSPDGLIEAAELESHPFCIGVQWHPERTAPEQDGPSRRLFQIFIESARQYAAQRLSGATP